jgi:asparagine synthase (glutamine-hydrolysing)
LVPGGWFGAFGVANPGFGGLAQNPEEETGDTMCGICGFNWCDKDLVETMAGAIAHRGPDQEGSYADENVSLAHRRLSIIDLSEKGTQPMTNEDGSLWLVFNGEIYNFPSLRARLADRGHRFSSNTDTEVILHAYEEYGPNCVDHLSGMFAFAIWDRRRRELFLARDRIGIKPLYYYHKNGRFIFASEIKAILCCPDVSRELDPLALYYYLAYEFVPAPLTMFRDIKKLQPGHTLTLRDGQLYDKEYWDLTFHHEPKPESYYRDRLLELLENAVRSHLISDVPLGVFLSGGLDSSTVVALMHRILGEGVSTFSLGYEDPTFSELEYARQVARYFNTNHSEIIIEPLTHEDIETAAWHLDEPMTDLSTIPFYMISRRAREDVKVCLSGEGGDELFAGYDRFKASRVDRYFSLVPEPIRRHLIAPLVRALPDQPSKKGAINMLKRFIDGAMLPKEGGHIRWQCFGSPEQDAALFKPEFIEAVRPDLFAPIRYYMEKCSSESRLDREIYTDIRGVMPDSVLMKVDKMSMAHALEVRVPFLDYEFVEFTATIPPHLKLRRFTTKAVFREAIDPILPPGIAWRKKQGYSLPIKNWLREEMRDYMVETLSCSPVIKQHLRMEYVNTLIAQHLARTHNHNHILWSLINVAVWHRLFVEEKKTGRSAVVAAASGG